MIRKIVGLAVLYVVAGVACKAGEELWNGVLRDKTKTLWNAVTKKSVKTESN